MQLTPQNINLFFDIFDKKSQAGAGAWNDLVELIKKGKEASDRSGEFDRPLEQADCDIIQTKFQPLFEDILTNILAASENIKPENLMN